MFFRHRREIYSGYSRRRFVELRDRLQERGIPVSYRFESVNDGSRRNVIANFQMITRYHLYTPAFLKESLAKNFKRFASARFLERKRGKEL